MLGNTAIGFASSRPFNPILFHQKRPRIKKVGAQNRFLFSFLMAVPAAAASSSSAAKRSASDEQSIFNEIEPPPKAQCLAGEVPPSAATAETQQQHQQENLNDTTVKDLATALDKLTKVSQSTVRQLLSLQQQSDLHAQHFANAMVQMAGMVHFLDW